MKESKKGDQSKENEILLRLSKTLVSISPTSRKKGLDIINRYISKNDSSLTRIQIIKLWKGLYYSMWLSDKVLVQREIAIGISNLQKKFSSLELWLSFIEEFYLMMRFRWDCIDHYRMDKFIFLQRTMLSESLELIKSKNFENSYINGFFDVLLNSIFIENINDNHADLNKKYRFDSLKNAEEKSLVNSNNQFGVNKLTGIGISLIFCKQFPQEYVYLIYELYKLEKKGDYPKNIDEFANTFFTNYSCFVVKLLTSDISHKTLNEYITKHLIFSLFNSESLLSDVLKEIEDLKIDENEMNVINNFVKDKVAKQMMILQNDVAKASKLKTASISQAKRNRLYGILEKVEEFLDTKKDSSDLLKISKNKMRNIKYKQENNPENQSKKVRFDMTKNIHMLLPDSPSTSKALVKIFDKKYHSQSSDELNCILFRSVGDKESSDTIDYNSPVSKGLRNIEIISADKALSKPPNSKSSPSRGILRKNADP